MVEIIKRISDFQDKSLLIVDDDNPFRNRLAHSMEKKGFKVTQAESVKSGIQKARESRPAFAVVDLRLGDGYGLEVVRELHQSKKESKIIMLTGYGTISTAVAAIKAGGNGLPRQTSRC